MSVQVIRLSQPYNVGGMKAADFILVEREIGRPLGLLQACKP